MTAAATRYTMRIKFINPTRRKIEVEASSEASEAAAQGLLEAKLKMQAGFSADVSSVLSGSTSTTLDIAAGGFKPGHDATNGNDGLAITIYSPTLLEKREIRIQSVSGDYADANNPGYVALDNADLLAVVAAYNTAVPDPGDFVLREARFTKEG